MGADRGRRLGGGGAPGRGALSLVGQEFADQALLHDPALGHAALDAIAFECGLDGSIQANGQGHGECG